MMKDRKEQFDTTDAGLIVFVMVGGWFLLFYSGFVF